VGLREIGRPRRLLAALALVVATLDVQLQVSTDLRSSTVLEPRIIVAKLLLAYVGVFWLRAAIEIPLRFKRSPGLTEGRR
jgi:hypothetical protein